jgi:hypothetical protein
LFVRAETFGLALIKFLSFSIRKDIVNDKRGEKEIRKEEKKHLNPAAL